ncbi:MAG: peptidylprolyl isomerase [Chitinispirillaceae bacterium]
MKTTLLLIALLASATFFFCSQKEKSDIALVVNGEEISNSLIEETAELFRQQQLQINPEKALEGVQDDMRKSAARQLAANVLMLEKVKSRGWVIDTALVQANYKAMVSRFGSDEKFKEGLESMGESEESFRKHIEEEILLDSLIKELVSKVKPAGEKECREYYEKHKERYIGTPRVRASQILFSLSSSADSSEVESMEQKARDVHIKAKAGEDFDALAKSYSSIPMPADIGWFKKGDLIPDLEKVLFSLEIGQVSDVIKSNMGFHIVKKTDEEAQRPLKFKEVEELIRKSLDLSRKSKLISGYIDDLISKADIKYVDTTLVIDGESTEQLLLER